MKKLKLNRNNLVHESQHVIEWWLSWNGIMHSTRPSDCDDMIRLAQICRIMMHLDRWNKIVMAEFLYYTNLLQKSYCIWNRIPVITNQDVFDI